MIRSFWVHPLLISFFQFLIGATLAFHWSFTAEAVHLHQPDLKMLGHLLSTVLILLGNILILGFLGVCLFKSAETFKFYGTEILQETAHVWKKGLVLLSAIQS